MFNQNTPDTDAHRFTVVLSEDGCWRRDLLVGVSRARAFGFLRANWTRYTRGRWSLDLVDRATGRYVSFIL